MARKAGVGRISAPGLRSSAERGERTIYRFDVRSPAEYAEGHLAGFRSAPGGQLVQETDWFAPVRGALVVLADDGGGRAAMTASWLAQMGWEVAVLEARPESGAAETGPWAPAWPSPPELPLADPARVEGWLRDGGAAVVDVDTSRRFLAGHIPGAAWALRGDLSGGGPPRGGRSPGRRPRGGLAWGPGRTGRMVLTSADGMLARFAAAGVPAAPGTQVLALAGGTAGWAASGRPLQSGPGEMLSAPVDVYRRPYEGTSVDPAAMQAYLDWEYGLVAQLGRDGTHGFSVLT